MQTTLLTTMVQPTSTAAPFTRGTALTNKSRAGRSSAPISTVRIVLLGVALSFIALVSWLLFSLQLPLIYYISFMYVIAVGIGLTGGVYLLNKLLNYYYPWQGHTGFRFGLQIGGTVAVALLCVNLTYWLFKLHFTQLAPTFEQFVVVNLYGLLLLVPMVSIHIGYFFSLKWKRSFLQSETLRRETMRAEYQALKSHLDPHFLFNNLNILSSLIDPENQKASLFLEDFAEVYRYVLQTKTQQLVTLEQEIEAGTSYLKLMEQRFGNALKFEINIAKHQQKKLLPPLTLQLLLENMVKHNVLSETEPLYLRIEAQQDDTLLVMNSVRAKCQAKKWSAGSGLQNIRKRYGLLSERDIHVEATSEAFSVTLPLLQF